MSMTLYIDGDALPNLLKPILFRALEKLSLQTIVVSIIAARKKPIT